MAKQTIFGRIAQLAKANINALIDAAEDPEKMLDQMERETELDARLAALKAKNAPAAPAPLAVETPTQTL